MKTRLSICHRPRQREGGSAVMVVMILLVIMLIFVMANTVTLNLLRRQVMLVDQHQARRLAQSATNQPLSK